MDVKLELSTSIAALLEQRESLRLQILAEETDVAEIQKALSNLTDQLFKRNESIVRKVRLRDEYDRSLDDARSVQRTICDSSSVLSADAQSLAHKELAHLQSLLRSCDASAAACALETSQTSHICPVVVPGDAPISTGVEQLTGFDSCGADDLDYDSNNTKILHLKRGPAGILSCKGDDPDELPASAAPFSDLIHRQAEKRLERLRKATKKYVTDFREGIAALLGWRIEMKDTGEWIISSNYGNAKHHEIAFQCRPRKHGNPAEFDLLSTPWAEMLLEDREALACLEVYNSIPAFLAHVTMDMVSRQNLPA